MATWDDLDGVMGTTGAKRLGTTGWAWSIPLDGDKEQTVFVFRELIAPDLELVRAMSAFAHTSEADVAAVLREHGQLSAGSIAYTPAADADARGGGNLALSTVMPLAVLDLSTPHPFPHPFLLHLSILGRAALDIGQRLAAANQVAPAAPAVAPPGHAAEPSAADDAAPDTPGTRGWNLEEAGDLAGAEAAYRQGDEEGDGSCTAELGRLLAMRGDMDGAEAAFRRADERGATNGSYNLGILLADHRHDLAGAEAVWRRAAEHGHASAAYNLGALLQEQGDLAGAEIAWQQSSQLGEAAAAFNLGLLRQQGGDEPGAESAWRRGDELGSVESTVALARRLEERGDRDGAEALHRKADAAGDANAAYSLGSILWKRGEREGARGAFTRAADRGHPGAPEILKLMDQ